jgi:uncharacterized membrane protein
VAGGELTSDDKERINAEVADAEQKAGFEICVVVMHKRHKDARRDAESAFHRLGMHDRPAVLVMVTPAERTLEVVTAAHVRDRLSDVDCDEAVRLMTGVFATGDIVDGIAQGVRFIGERGSSPDGKLVDGPDLPNLLDLDDDL